MISKVRFNADRPPKMGVGSRYLVTFAIKDNSKIFPSTWHETVEVSDHSVSFKIDTGSDVNLISHYIFKKLKPKPKLVQSAVKLSSYTGHLVSTLGFTQIKCVKSGKELMIKFFVTNLSAENVLGLHACIDFGLVVKIPAPVEVHSAEKVLKLFADVFSTPEVMRCKPYHISLVANAKLLLQATCRKVPQSLKMKLEAELHKMMERGVIEPADDTASYWIHSAIITNEPLGIYMDCRQLNKHIIADNFPMSLFEEALSNTKGSQYFSLLTVPEAPAQLPLDEASSSICVVMTPCGKYKFKTIPYGLIRASNIFHSITKQVLSDIEGVVVHAADILIHGKTKEEHNTRLTHLLERARKCNLKFHPTKLQLAKPEVRFMGCLLSGTGATMDPSKLEAIKSMEVPLNKQELQRFVNMVACANLSAHCHPLQKLLDKSEKFVWRKEHDLAFNTLKSLLCEPPVLKNYIPSKTLYITVVASSYGLGAAAFQEGHPLGYYSTALDKMQQKYPQIEKKLQAILFGLESFHLYTVGKEVVVQSDHRPLINIIKEPLDMIMSPRLQAILLTLMKFHFKLEYVAAKDLAVAYALSRSPLKHFDTYKQEPSPPHALLCASEARISDFKQSLKEDPVLQHVISYVREGWPKYPSWIKNEAKYYFAVKDHLLYIEDLLFYDSTLVVPEKQKQNVLEQLHTAHQSARACVQRAQLVYYWSNMVSDVESFVSNCLVCQSPSNSLANSCAEIPELPWNKLGIDLVHAGRRDYVFILDYFSRFLIVKPVNVKTAKALISILEDSISILGLPMEILSPNAPPFNTAAWKLFLKTHDIKHIVPRGDNVMETQREIVKSLVVRSMGLFLAVLEYNSTPTQNLPSPSELLMGRRLRTNLLVPKAMLVPNYDVSKAVAVMKKDQECDWPVKRLANLKKN